MGTFALLLYLAAMAYAVKQARPEGGDASCPGILGITYQCDSAQSARAPQSAGRYTVPGWFRDQAQCIYSHENGGYGWHAHTGNGYETGLQFLPSTWARAGGRFHSPEGHFYGYTVAEIVYRAYRIWRMDGGRWSEWSTAGMCGLA